MTNPIDDDRADWRSFSSEHLHALTGQSDNFATARRLISCVATNAEHDDGGDSLGRLLLEVASGDPVAVAVACAVEAVLHARARYESHTGAVLAERAARQIDLAQRNREQFGEPS